jgi:hypothetical protein
MGDIVADAVAMAEWVSQALSRSGYRADFAPASLAEIDRFLDEQCADGQPTRGGLLAEDTGRMLFAVGAYVGEVLRREMGGEWHPAAPHSDSELGLSLVLPDRSVVWPVARVMKRYVDGPDEGIAAYGAALGLVVDHDVGGSARLISRSCTTGWLDWGHGELWLTETALVRVRRSRGHTPPTNRHLSFAEIAAARLHRGRVNDRLSVTLHSGGRHKLLWLSSEAAYGVLLDVLPRHLHGRLTLD